MLFGGNNCQSIYSLLEMMRRNVGILFGHREVVVPEEFFDRIKVDASQSQVGWQTCVGGHASEKSSFAVVTQVPINAQSLKLKPPSLEATTDRTTIQMILRNTMVKV